MPQEINQAYEKLLKSKTFKKEGFLCGFFVMCEIDELGSSLWQIDFYDKKSGKITSYTMGKNITINPETEVFKNPETKVEKLEFEKVKTNFKEAHKKAEELLKKHHEEATKMIIILQQEQKPVWNLSYITKRLNLLNIKIDATNNNILEEKVVTLLSFKKE